MTSTFSSKKFLVKFVAVVISVVMVLSFAPLKDVFNTITSVSAAEAPVYDPSLGDFSQSTENGNIVLTATPKAGAGFRGWFLKDGTEVSYNTKYTLPAGAAASDYVPVFYNFNFIKNGGFEEYAAGTSLKTGVPADEVWGGVTYESIHKGETDWTKAIVSNNRARTGSKSLELTSFHHVSYKDITGLEPNTQYTLTYYYNIDNNPGNYLDKTYIVDSSITNEQMLTDEWRMDRTTKYLAKKVLGATDGVCATGEWKEVKMTFFTGDKTSVRLLIYFVADTSGTARPPLYLDDASLVKDILAAPSYFNEDYSTSAANWTPLAGGVTATQENGLCKVDATNNRKIIQSAPFYTKKGGKYTVNFTMNIANLTDDGNYINFSLTTAKGESSGSYVQSSKGSNNFSAILTQGSKTQNISDYFLSGTYSETCIQHAGLANGFDKNNDINVALSFDIYKDTPVYLNVWINGTGVYYLDNLSVTEDTTNIDVMDFTIRNTIETAGTAIRTEGVQGLRYKTRIDKRLLTSDMYYGFRVVEYGTAALKTAYCGNSKLTLDGIYDYGGVTYGAKTGVAYSFADGINKVFADDKTTLDFTGVLTNIGEKNYATDYTVRAYFKYVDKNGNAGIFYADEAEVAIYSVSKAAYSAKNANGEFTESEEIRNYLYNNIICKFTDKIISVSNTTPKYSNFQGIRSTVYHGTVFFPDSHNRTYTEAQAATEMDRLVDTKVDNVRTRFDSNWAWTANGWDWDSAKMSAFYKWGNMLEDRNISITIQAGWHLYDFICFYNKQFNTGITDTQDPENDGHSSIPEVNYLHGYNDDASAKVSAKYGEDANAAKIEEDARALGLNFTTNEFEHYSVAAARYGEWIKQGINALKAHGVNNVKYVIPFTESGDVRSNDPTYSYDEWIIMTIGLNNALKDAGLRNGVKLIGPAQSLYASQNRESLLEYVYGKIRNNNEYKNMIEINAMHQYSTPNTGAGYSNSIYDPEACYSTAEANFSYYDDVLTNAGVRNQEFWCDEYFAFAPNAKWWSNVGMQMTQFAAGLTAGINNGVNRFLTWQMFDCLWDAERTHGTGVVDNSAEFSGGIHAVGTCPALVHVDGKTCPNGASCPCTANYNISSYVPRVTYYGINLIGKYLNSENAEVYDVDVLNDVDKHNDIYVSAIKNDAGDNVVIVVNTTQNIINVDLQFATGDVKSLKRYTYDPSVIVPTAEAKSIPSDKTITLSDSGSLIDTIPAQSFAIYVEGSNIIGDDVNIPWFD